MIGQKQYSGLLEQLRKIVPVNQIYTDELRTLGWGTDASFYHMVPRIVVRSSNDDEVAAVIKCCYERHIPFTFRAAGTSLSGQSVSDSVLIVAGKHWEKYRISEDHNTITMQHRAGWRSG